MKQLHQHGGLVFGDRAIEKQCWLGGRTMGEHTAEWWSVHVKFSLPSIASFPNRSVKTLLQNVARSDALVFNPLLIVPESSF